MIVVISNKTEKYDTQSNVQKTPTESEAPAVEREKEPEFNSAPNPSAVLDLEEPMWYPTDDERKAAHRCFGSEEQVLRLGDTETVISKVNGEICKDQEIVCAYGAMKLGKNAKYALDINVDLHASCEDTSPIVFKQKAGSQGHRCKS